MSKFLLKYLTLLIFSDKEYIAEEYVLMNVKVI